MVFTGNTQLYALISIIWLVLLNKIMVIYAALIWVAGNLQLFVKKRFELPRGNDVCD